MVSIPDDVTADLLDLLRDAPDAAYRERLTGLFLRLGYRASRAEVDARVERYVAVDEMVERLASEPCPLADFRVCLRMAVGVTELLRENGNRQPTQRDIAEALAEYGAPGADAIVAAVWNTDAFHRHWLRLLPSRRPLAEALAAS